MNLKELYQEIILEHGKNPRNLRKTEGFNKDAKGNNPLCGDNVHVYLKLNGQKIVEDASFEGSGCAISMASASIMTDLIKGKNEHEAKEIVEDFLGMIKENPELNSKYLSEDEKTKLMCLSGVKQYPMRVKCATLSWHTMVSAETIVCQDKVAHLTLIGYCLTPDKHISLVFSSSLKYLEFNSGFSLIIPKKSSTISLASCSFFPLIKSVIIEADAIEIAQPLPSKDASSTIFCPFSFR